MQIISSDSARIYKQNWCFCRRLRKLPNHTRYVLKYALDEISSPLLLSPYTSFSLHGQLFRALLAKWLFTCIILATNMAKFSQFCHLRQIRRFRNIRQLFGALLNLLCVLTRVILSTSLAKFCQICNLEKISTVSQISSNLSISSTRYCQI